MSKDILVDVDIIKDHPNRINELIERVIEEIEAVRREGYELYTLTVKKQQECNSKIEDLSNQYRKTKSEGSPIYQNCAVDSVGDQYKKKDQYYRDEQEEDFYSGDLKRQFDNLDCRMNSLNHSKDSLDDISEQVVNISKTIEDIKQKSEYWNKIFTVVINNLIDLNNRG